MVTTRRSVAVSKATASESTKQNADYNLSSDQDSESEEYDESDDDNFKAPMSTAKPSAKRQKTTAATKVKKGEAGQVTKAVRRRKDLSLLPSMPLDILFEIFGQLSPKDLISLSRTNKLFRETLLAPNATTVWKGSRELLNAPEPPRDYKEPQWAALLFSTSCWSCGAKGIPCVDWYLRKRVCIACKKKHGKVKSRFPDYEREAFEYVTYTNTSGWTNGRKSNSKYYWDDDVHPIVEEWSNLEHAAHLGQIGAKDNLEKWKKQRVDKLEYVAKMAPKYEAWESRMSFTKLNNAQDNRAKRLAAVKAKFLELGYEAVDIDRALSVHSDGIRTGTANVTNAVWNRLRLKLEPCVESRRNQRVARELEPITKQRMLTLEGLYDGYLSSLKPSDRYRCPHVLFLRPLPEVSTLIEAPKGVVVTANDFRPILDNITNHIEAYHDKRRQSAIDPLLDTDDKACDPLSLAKNVFTCESSSIGYYLSHHPPSHVFLGWPMISSHCCIKRSAFNLRPGVYLDRPCKATYNKRYSAIASQIIATAGLDPSTASPEEMDRQDVRFSCGICPSSKKETFTWRGAVFHVTTHSSGDVTFRIAPDTLAAEAKAATPSIWASALAWSCNHCHNFVEREDARSQSEILQHLKTKHAIIDPVVTRDYFPNERCRDLLEAPYTPAKPPVLKTFQCLQCPSGSSSNRRFNEPGVRNHLKDKHKVLDPIANTYFKNHAACQ